MFKTLKYIITFIYLKNVYVITLVGDDRLAKQFLSNVDYHQPSNISHTLVANKIVDHSDVVGAAPASWSIPCLCCSNYIFILHFTPGFSGLGKDNLKTRNI